MSPTYFSSGSIEANTTVLFDNQVDITTKQIPSGSTLTPEEYTVQETLENGGQAGIANFISGSTKASAIGESDCLMGTTTSCRLFIIWNIYILGHVCCH